VNVKGQTRDFMRSVVPWPLRRAVHQARGRTVAPPAGAVRLGDLRRPTPVGPVWAIGRGTAVDRYYIEAFLDEHRSEIRGRVLEVGDDTYTRRFGGDRVTQRDVLHIDRDAPGATFVGDLADGSFLPSAAFDCIILTQTLHLILDFGAALDTLQRILRPGGVLLLTVPGITPVDPGRWATTWLYTFTEHALERLCARHFDADEVEIRSYGNALTAVAFLHNLSWEEFDQRELDAHVPSHSIVNVARVRCRPAQV
jgi:SAM-dependent methyltransferase